MLKADVGDNAGTADNALIHGNVTREVESAKAGDVGVEIGAGLTIPVGSRGGTFFIDGSFEFRSRYSDINASAGYRISF